MIRAIGGSLLLALLALCATAQAATLRVDRGGDLAAAVAAAQAG